MKNIIKTTAYSAVGSASLAMTALNTFAKSADVDLYGKDEAESYKHGSGWDIMDTLQSILSYILWFTAFVATAYAIYGGFQILTASWDDDKVKKWKTTLINALIGIFVIFMAWTLVDWIFSVWTEVTTL